MKITILGCSGGIGLERRTTCLRIDDDILIDAGTGVGDMSLDEMARIRHVFITHSHLDHIAGLPLLVDSIFERIEQPIVVHAQALTLNALRTHVFNNIIWPDFSRLPYDHSPVMVYQELANESIEVGQRRLTMIPVKHVVPAVGYRIESLSSGAAFAFSGDTTTNDTFWAGLNQFTRLDALVVESAFANKDLKLSQLAGHYCPQLLGPDLAKLKHKAQVYLTHAKPGEEEQIFKECQQAITSHSVKRITGGMTIEL